MANWHKRGAGMKVRYRGGPRGVKDVVEKTNKGWRVTVEGRVTSNVLFGGNKYFRLQRDAIAALDKWLETAANSDKVDRRPNMDEHQHENRESENEQCDSCGGSGKYYGHGYMENGVFKGFVGKCYRCDGKGFQDEEDQRRNRYYDNHIRRIES